MWLLKTLWDNQILISMCYKSSCILLFSLYTVIVLCTSLHLWTLLFCIYYYYCCCTVCTALLFSYSAVFIAASVRNKLIHSYSFVCLSLRLHVVVVAFGSPQPAIWSYHAADCQPTAYLIWFDWLIWLIDGWIDWFCVCVWAAKRLPKNEVSSRSTSSSTTQRSRGVELSEQQNRSTTCCQWLPIKHLTLHCLLISQLLTTSPQSNPQTSKNRLAAPPSAAAPPALTWRQ